MAATLESRSFPVEVICRLSRYDGTNKVLHTPRFMAISCHGGVKTGLLVLAAYALSQLQDLVPLIDSKGAFAL